MAALYEEDDDIEILCFLLNRKYFFEKSNLLKSIRGCGKNVFFIESVEIPSQYL